VRGAPGNRCPYLDISNASGRRCRAPLPQIVIANYFRLSNTHIRDKANRAQAAFLTLNMKESYELSNDTYGV
jgi:hypothetical protein